MKRISMSRRSSMPLSIFWRSSSLAAGQVHDVPGCGRRAGLGEDLADVPTRVVRLAASIDV
jgi:hypothetical protein